MGAFIVVQGNRVKEIGLCCHFFNRKANLFVNLLVKAGVSKKLFETISKSQLLQKLLHTKKHVICLYAYFDDKDHR